MQAKQALSLRPGSAIVSSGYFRERALKWQPFHAHPCAPKLPAPFFVSFDDQFLVVLSKLKPKRGALSQNGPATRNDFWPLGNCFCYASAFPWHGANLQPFHARPCAPLFVKALRLVSLPSFSVLVPLAGLWDLKIRHFKMATIPCATMRVHARIHARPAFQPFVASMFPELPA